MAFEGLTQRLQQAFGKIRSKGKLTEEDVKLVMREVRMALLEADVNYKVVKDFVKKATERCVGQEILESLSAQQQIIKIVNEELTQLMGGSNARLQFSSSPVTVFMLCGLQGAGKTTMAAKLANFLKKTGKKPMLAACDIYRPAAITQLQVVGKQVDVPVYEHGTQDPVKTALEAIEHTFGRMESIWKPVAANEGFEVVRRRLFLDCKNPGARDMVCEHFSAMYRENTSDFPLETKELEYKNRLVSCYPIHPEVFDRLYDDWATLERFQRTALGTLPEKPIVIKSFVTTDLAQVVADKYGAEMRNTLTGFKYIGEQIDGMSGATITSKAVTAGVNAAVVCAKNLG